MRRFFWIFALMIFAAGLMAVDNGEPAQNFTLNDINGKDVSLSDFKDKVVILDFWAIRCGVCTAEMPYWQELYDKYKDRGLVVIAVNCGESRDAVKKFVEENGYTFVFLVDWAQTVARQYGIRFLATTFFIVDGMIEYEKIGALSEAAQKNLINRIEQWIK